MHAPSASTSTAAPAPTHPGPPSYVHHHTRGVVFGAYGEASADVHDLISASASSQAETMGARSLSEMRAFLVARYRRQLGCTAVLAFVRQPTVSLHTLRTTRRLAHSP